MGSKLLVRFVGVGVLWTIATGCSKEPVSSSALDKAVSAPVPSQVPRPFAFGDRPTYSYLKLRRPLFEKGVTRFPDEIEEAMIGEGIEGVRFFDARSAAAPTLEFLKVEP